MPEIACSPDKISIIIRYNPAFSPKFYQTEPVYLILIQKKIELTLESWQKS